MLNVRQFAILLAILAGFGALAGGYVSLPFGDSEADDEGSGCFARDAAPEATLTRCAELIRSIEGRPPKQRNPRRLGEAHARRGMAFLQQGKSGAAMGEAEEALHAQPNTALANVVLGFGYLQGDDGERALRQFDHAVSLDSKRASALFGRSLARRRKGDRAGADADLAAAKALDAGIAERMASLGGKP